MGVGILLRAAAAIGSSHWTGATAGAGAAYGGALASLTGLTGGAWNGNGARSFFCWSFGLTPDTNSEEGTTVSAADCASAAAAAAEDRSLDTAAAPLRRGRRGGGAGLGSSIINLFFLSFLSGSSSTSWLAAIDASSYSTSLISSTSPSVAEARVGAGCEVPPGGGETEGKAEAAPISKRVLGAREPRGARLLSLLLYLVARSVIWVVDRPAGGRADGDGKDLNIFELFFKTEK